MWKSRLALKSSKEHRLCLCDVVPQCFRNRSRKLTCTYTFMTKQYIYTIHIIYMHIYSHIIYVIHIINLQFLCRWYIYYICIYIYIVKCSIYTYLYIFMCVSLRVPIIFSRSYVSISSMSCVQICVYQMCRLLYALCTDLNMFYVHNLCYVRVLVCILQPCTSSLRSEHASFRSVWRARRRRSTIRSLHENKRTYMYVSYIM